jgi:hypothetical protein
MGIIRVNSLFSWIRAVPPGRGHGRDDCRELRWLAVGGWAAAAYDRCLGADHPAIELEKNAESSTANVSPMKRVNQTRTNAINRLQIHRDLQAFFDPEPRS